MPRNHLPSPVILRSLKYLGADIREARLRRRLPMTVVAERASTTRLTISKIENGAPSVSIGIYASVLQALGLLDALAKLADPTKDEIGKALAQSELPQRARIRSRSRDA